MFFGKIPVTISPFFWLLAIFIGWIGSMTLHGTLVWMLVIVGSLLFHEFGHALTAIYFGQKASVQLVAFGGLTTRRGPKLKWWQEFVVILNGPLAGLLLFGIALLFKVSLPKAGPLLSYTLQVTMIINFFWSILNLVPVLPLDGGRLLSIGLEGLLGFRGVKLALFLSVLIGGLISFLFFIIRMVLPGAIFMLLAFESFRSWRETMKMNEKDRDEELQKLLEEGRRDFEHGRFDEAMEKLQYVTEEAGRGVLNIAATQLMAAILSEENKSKAYELLASRKNNLDFEGLRLFHHLAYQTGHLEEAIAIGNAFYQSLPSYETALTNALCCALLEKVQPAVGWLQCALREGVPDLEEVLENQDFDKIRHHPHFQKFIKSLVD